MKHINYLCWKIVYNINPTNVTPFRITLDDTNHYENKLILNH